MKNSKQKSVLILMGPPGSGKGTQAKLLVKKFGLVYFGSGDTLRKRSRIQDFTGKKLFQVMTKGELVPSFLISKIWTDEFEKLKKKPKFKGMVLDGWNRTIFEAELFDESLEWYGWKGNEKILLIDVSKKESIWRLTKRRMCKKCGRLIPYVGEFRELKKCDKCGGKLIRRKDQSLKTIKKRLEEFKEDTIPTINHYKKQGRLIEINGEQSIEDVFKDILKVIR